MTQPKTLLTADEFFRLYSHKDGRYELVDGEVVEMDPVNEQHGDTAFNISGAFFVYSRQRGIGRGAWKPVTECASIRTSFVAWMFLSICAPAMLERIRALDSLPERLI